MSSSESPPASSRSAELARGNILNLLALSHRARILVTGSKTRLAGRKEKTVLTLACMACGETFETDGFKVSDIDAAVEAHIKRGELE